MEFINEYGLLVAIATPVAVIAIINVVLAFGGETGTLLLPTLKGYPAVLEQGAAVVAPAPAEVAELVQVRRVERAPVDSGFEEADEMLARQAA